MDPVISLLLRADSRQAQAALRETSAEVRDLGGELGRMGTAAAPAATGIRAVAASAQEVDRASRGAGQAAGYMTMQLNDVFTMVMAGQAPLQTAIQQGLQMTQVLGPMGAGGALRTVAQGFMSMLSPVNLATIGIIAGVSALAQWALSAGSAEEETRTLEDALTLRAAGRDWAMVQILPKSGSGALTWVDLATGSLGAQTGLTSRQISDRGDGWWRVRLLADVGAGPTSPALRVFLGSGSGVSSYAGDGIAAVDLSEMQARVAGDFDLFVPADAAGLAKGTAGGSAWFAIDLAFGGGFRRVEARFQDSWEARALPAIGWQVTATLEVRNA